RGSQIPRAVSLITVSLDFIHDLHTGVLEPDAPRGIPLDIASLFGTARIPISRGCRTEVQEDSQHIATIPGPNLQAPRNAAILRC
ncbi:hypothetical protein BOTBODRAFT_119396, partial [Botryobasidium botryosum FD-172 SS1]